MQEWKDKIFEQVNISKKILITNREKSKEKNQ